MHHTPRSSSRVRPSSSVGGWRSAWRSLSLCAAVAAGTSAAAVVWAADPVSPPAPAGSGKSPAGPVVPAGPGGSGGALAAGSSGAAAAGGALPLEEKAYERPSAGISIRAPKGWSNLVEADRDEIVRFADDPKKQDWNLVVTRQTFPEPQNLTAVKDARGEVTPGVVENTLASLKQQLPGAKVLRAGDPTVVDGHEVGVIILRYTKNGERRLNQYAIVKANDQLYYMVRLSSPARKDVTEDANEEERTVDPGERQAIETFRGVVDAVKLLDLRVVREDQTQRLFRTRGLFANLTERRLAATLIPERYLRVVRGGQDVGYSYVVEQPGRVDRKGQSTGGTDGFTVGIRTRLMTGAAAEAPGVAGVRVPAFPREDSEVWMYCTTDRRTEDWSAITVFDDGKPKTPDHPWRKASEVGSSQFQVRRVAVNKTEADLKRPEAAFQRGERGDNRQPWVENRESYNLTVQFRATRGDLPTFTNPLPPFYLPQALGSMLPRLVPATEPKTYMFAAYVSDMRQVMARYVDVRPEAPLPSELVRARAASVGGGDPAAAAAGVGFAGGGVAGRAPAVPTSPVRGIPIDDRLGYEGTVTTHWVTAKGEYLGSVTPSTRTVVVPTDERALKRIWNIADGDNLHGLPAGAGAGDEFGRGPDGGSGLDGGRVGPALVNPVGPPGSDGSLPARIGSGPGR